MLSLTRAFPFLFLFLALICGRAFAPDEKLPPSFTDKKTNTVYKVLARLGSGGNADVYKVEKPGNPPQIMALKVYREWGGANVQQAAEEKLLAGIESGRAPHLLAIGAKRDFATQTETTVHTDDEVDLFGTRRTQATDVVARLMPISDGMLKDGAFMDRTKALRDPNATPAQVREALRVVTEVQNQTSTALGELFALGLVHGDINLANFMYFRRPGQKPDFEIHLADFDTVHERGSTPKELMMTLPFGAPEVFRSPSPGGHLTSQERDVYAWSSAMYQAVFGKPPMTDYLDHLGRDTGKNGILSVMAFPDGYAGYLSFVQKRFDELEKKAGGDREILKNLRQTRNLVLAGLTEDPAQRMQNLQRAASDSPLVAHLPKLGGFARLGCAFSRLRGRVPFRIPAQNN